MADFAVYGGLFLSAFLSATLLPGSSEALLTGLVVSGRGAPLLLLAAAVMGNVLGSLVNWICGRFLAAFRDRKWFPVSPRRYAQAASWFERYGVWSLLFAWAPVVGDPLTLIAGAFRVGLLPFLLLVTVGKLVRYLFILWVALSLA